VQVLEEGVLGSSEEKDGRRNVWLTGRGRTGGLRFRTWESREFFLDHKQTGTAVLGQMADKHIFSQS